MKTDLHVELAVPSGVTVTLGELVVVKGPKGEVKRSLKNSQVSIKQENGKLVVESKNATKNEKRMLGTFESHLANMLKGALEGFVYELKICSGHFPINVAVVGKELVVKNFLGESFPRKLALRAGVTVKVEGEKIFVSGADLENVAQTAADIERLTRITGRDLRIFQDGCYIVKKADMVVE